VHLEVDGLRLYADVLSPEYVAEGPRLRRRPTVVLLHGSLDGDSALVRPLGDLLTGVASVVVTDRRANGRSDGGGDPATWTIDRWADDVYELCTAMGIVKPIVVGTSYGGFIALNYAIRHPDHPAGLAVLSAGARFDRDALLSGWEQALGGRTPEELADVATRTARVIRRRAVAAYPPHAYLLDMDLRPGLGAITCPTLVAVGDEDPITPMHIAEELVAGIGPELAGFHPIAGAGHALELHAAEEIGALLREFITGIGAPPDPWVGGTPYDEPG
jgi:proline iminopeptidase